MSKLFCEICGTAYSDTADQCPICGCPKPESAEFAAENQGEYASDVRAAGGVRGGRFSKANVNKRIKNTASVQSVEKPVRKSNKRNTSRNNAERTLIIIICVLLAAIIAVVGFIVVKYLIPRQAPELPPKETTLQIQPDTQPQPTVQPTTVPQEIRCTGLSLSEESIRFNEEGATWLLSVIPTPANTTDSITYLSSDTSVATVDTDGRVTAVGDGTCIITIVCGDIAIECNVVCELDEKQTQPTETQPEETQPEENEDFKLNRDDFTLTVGGFWRLYDGPIDASKIIWTSSNTSVATVTNGVVKGIGPGQCWITAEYNGVKLKCIVYVTA